MTDNKPENSGAKRTKDGRFTKASAAAFGAKGGKAGKGSLSIVAIIKKKLEGIVSREDRRSKAEFLAEKWIDEAMHGDDFKKLQEIVRYVDGLPQQKVDHTSGGEKIDFNTKVIFEDASNGQ